MKMFKILGISLLAALACLTTIAAFGVAPSAAAGYDNWTRPYNQYWGNSTAGNGGTFIGCAVAWGQSSCIVSENVTNNSLGTCATAWGNSRCIAPGR
ncbi:MAG: hypothetical protein ABSF74_01420 [Dehalococcoidia bacterium]|jgi:hypothetical protein